MNPLERRCRLLLQAYPAAYREVRGEEIIGTLLEATQPGRSWPLSRDIRGLIFGGLRARAVIDARPAIAISVFVMGLWLPNAVGNLTQGYIPLYIWPYLVITAAIAVPDVWLLRQLKSPRIASLTAAMCRAPAARDTRRAVR